MNKLLDLFNEKSAEVKPPVDESTFTAHEAVKLCLKGIRQCRKRKIPWDTIADNIRESVLESYGISISLTGMTAQRYYYQLTNKKKGKRSKPRSPSTSTTSRKSSAPAPAKPPVQVAQPTVPAVTPVPAPAPEPVARSPATELRPESEVAPVVGEPVTPETSQAASTEELHPNRFRDRFKKVKNPKTTTGYENCKTL